MMTICDTIKQRKSCRAYLDKPVDPVIIRQILEAARWAPSGVNHQPGQVAIVAAETKTHLSRRLAEEFSKGTPPNPDYLSCPSDWSDHYKRRRKACGSALYSSLNIAIDDVARRKEFRQKNYHFFHAPVGLIILMEKNMPVGSWIDIGMFIQNILLSAQDFSLATCPQAAIAEYPDIVREILGLRHVDIVCGIALGYPDLSHPVNSFRTEREPLEAFTHWYL